MSNLNEKIESLKLSNIALEKLKLSGIDYLNDFNTFTLKELKLLLGDEIFDEIMPTLRKYFLPNDLENLGLFKETVKILNEMNIDNLEDFLKSNKDELYKLVEDDFIIQKDLNDLLEAYGYEKLEKKKNEEETTSDISYHSTEEYVPDLLNINIDEHVKSRIESERKGHGSKKYSRFKIRLASPDEIRQWSYGEVLNHETINYRTSKPEIGGLFCERIFGPVKDYQCACGKKQSGNKGQVCSKCGIEITESKVRRERMGHINLESPVVHTWYVKGIPSKIAILLGVKTKQLEEVVYHASYIVTDPGTSSLTFKQILSEQEYSHFLEIFPRQFTAQSGAEAIKTLLKKLDLEKEAKILRTKIKTATGLKREVAIKRLEIVDAFNNSDNKPEWMVLDVIPVIPPDLRPMVALDGGRFATTDLNDLYRRILNRNNRLKKQKEQHAPRLILKNEKRMLQEAVDSLIDNSKRGKKAVVERGRNLKSLSDMLKGKQGRLRQNLLGKRVDYSARSVIIVGPDLEMYQCGIPREMAIILFKPFILRDIQKVNGLDKKNANTKYETMDDDVWQSLERVVVEHPVLLNRAPTLHRLGIQAFEPKLIDGKAIRLHPLVTPAFNADFDGDQMAVHLPLSDEAQAEARLLMLASNNILNPKDGKPVVTPSQDMVLGNYYLTIDEVNENEIRFFTGIEEAKVALENKEIKLHSRIIINPNVLKHKFSDEQKEMYLVTTLGKLIFNEVLPESFYYLNEPTTTNLEKGTPDLYFIPKGENPKDYIGNIPKTQPFNKKFLSQVISRVFKLLNVNETSIILDKVKDLGFKYSTVAGFTISYDDINVYSKKDEIIKNVRLKLDEISNFYELGLLTDEERKKLVIKEWENAGNIIKKGLSKELTEDNHIYMMMNSGARGSISSFVQLSGMRGLMRNPKGETIEVPVQASFREGLTVSEFFISTHGARKGSTDTALKTAESGYLTRRLVDVSQDVIVVEDDCGSLRGMYVKALVDNGKVIIPLKDRIIGRYASRDIVVGKKKRVIVSRNELITEEIADEIIKEGISEVEIRNVFTCVSENGISAKSYGRNLATNTIAEIGDAVGVIAAQSIGEPGTQLTMRTFHTGGVASASDITQGLPRIQELFEARKPKGEAKISEVHGKVKELNRLSNGTTEIFVTEIIKKESIYDYLIDKNDELLVEENQPILKGDKISSGDVLSEVSGYVLKIEDTPEDKILVLIKEEKVAKEYKYVTDPNVEILVRKNAIVTPGQKLSEGSINPKELLRVSSAEATQTYILEEVQKVYRAQDVEISDKHIEIIVRQMFRRIFIIHEGDSNLFPGTEVSVEAFKKAVRKTYKNGGKLPVGRPILLGITRASLRSDSFLSAASFQETTRILTEAAIKGSVDYLHGLKENVIIGGLIPAGTGILDDSSFEYNYLKQKNDDYDEY